MVGLIPLFAVEVLSDEVIGKLPGFQKRLDWFLDVSPRSGQAHLLHGNQRLKMPRRGLHLLAIPSRERLERVLRYVLDEDEFLSPLRRPLAVEVSPGRTLTFSTCAGQEFRVEYVPGESNTGLFGGNSNWRGPIWFPVNYLLIEALERYHDFYGDTLRGGVSDRLGPMDESWRGGKGVVLAACQALPAGRREPPSLPG